ncbi:MAG: DUF1223 domain-containing protein [Rhizobacter sp.]
MAALVALSLGPVQAAHAATCEARSPLTVVPVVELYTSQGCSSCPPADHWISKLRDQPHAVALAFHVSYWDYCKRPANPTLCKGIEGCEGCCFDNSEGAANGSGGMARQDQATTGRGSAVEAVRQKHCCVGAGPRDGCKAADGVGHL